MKQVTIVPSIYGHRVDKNGKCAVVIRVRLGKVYVHTEKLNYKINPDHWDSELKQVKRSAGNHTLINSLIRKKTIDLEAAFLQSEIFGDKLTKNKIKTIAKGGDHGKDFLQFCESNIKEKYPDTGRRGTRETYLSEITKLKEFREDLSFADVNYDFLTKYKRFLANEKKNHVNTIWKTFKWMNTMINDAIRHGGIIKDNPFKEFDRGKYKQGSRNYLLISDCDKLHEFIEKDRPEKMKVIAAYYLLMCYTGMRFNDATKNFKPSEHVKDDTHIILATEKTGSTIDIYIHDRLRKILPIIKENPIDLINKTFNDYLKIIGSDCGIKTTLTAHVGRHTFGATLAELGVPIEVAQRLLGHMDRKSTAIYYHITNKTLHDNMKKWDEL